MTTIQTIAKWIAAQLDKVKVPNPFLFLVIQGVLGILLASLNQDVINIPTPEIVGKILSFIEIDNLDNFFQLLIGAVMAAIGPRTTYLKNLEDAPAKEV